MQQNAETDVQNKNPASWFATMGSESTKKHCLCPPSMTSSAVGFTEDFPCYRTGYNPHTYPSMD